MARRKTSDQPFEGKEFLNPASDEMKAALDSMLQPSEQPAQTAEPQPEPQSESRPESRPEPRPKTAGKPKPPVRITGLRTISQAGPQSLFRWDRDALTLVIDMEASPAFIACGEAVDANFQIVHYGTNQVQLDYWTRGFKLKWGERCWISNGNHWGPKPSQYTTAEKWGLERGLFMFRALVEIRSLGVFAESRDSAFFRVS